jgi:nucleoside-diphosphate-sugar epimerase
MKILVTGSSGFLGSHTVRMFRKHNYKVLGVDIVPSDTTDWVGDIRNCCQQLTEQFDLLVHFSAEVKGRGNIEKNYLNMIANIDIDRYVFEWATKHVSHIVYPSSCAAYPVKYQNDINIPLKESMVDFESGVIGVSDHLYGWCKLTAERMLWQIQKETDLRVHVLRPFSGYGPGQSTDYPMANLVNLIKTSPDNIAVWGNGKQTRDWVHVDDIMRTVLWCAKDTSKHLTINIGTGHATDFISLAQQIYQIVHGRACPEIQCLQNRPSGVQHRVSDIVQQKQLGILPVVDLVQGIKTLV